MTKLAILGAGRIACTMADTVRRMNATGRGDVCLLAIAARDEKRAHAFAQENGIPRAYGSYEEMVRDPDIDLVYIATPHSHHAEHMRLCILNGKAVLCEKAFTANAKQAEEVLNLAHKKSILVTEAIWTRYQPMRKLIYDAVWSGIIGKPRTVQANLSYAISHKERIIDPALAGGALLDVGVYALNFCEMIFGHPDEAHACAVLTDRGCDETDSMTLLWHDGRVGILSAGTTAISEREGLIWCERGFIRVENINNPQRMQIYDENRQVIRDVSCPPQLTGYEYEVEEACETFTAGKTECASMPHAETLHIMRLMDHLRKQMGVVYPFE